METTGGSSLDLLKSGVIAFSVIHWSHSHKVLLIMAVLNWSVCHMKRQIVRRKQAHRLKWSRRTTGRLNSTSLSPLETKMLMPSLTVLGKFDYSFLYQCVLYSKLAVIPYLNIFNSHFKEIYHHRCAYVHLPQINSPSHHQQRCHSHAGAITIDASWNWTWICQILFAG